MTLRALSEMAADRRGVWLKRLMLAAFAALAGAQFASWALGVSAQEKKNLAEIRLGARLFADERFSTPNGDLPASCLHCHLFDEDPQGLRAHADFLSRSWVSSRLQDQRRNELRNSPTLFDVALMPRLHFDGEFGSLEELVTGTLAGRPMGWLPGEQQQAFDHIYRVLLRDAGEGRLAVGTYREQFKQVYGHDLEKLGRDEAINLLARSLSSYLRTLRTTRTTPYDDFIRLNELASEPGRGESSKVFAGRLLARLSALEAEGKLKLVAGFDGRALQGLKIFLRTEGSASAGNCVVCHVPPLFTDFSFHNTGISQSEYDQVHGEGSFAALLIPNAAQAVRPSARFRETPTKGRSGEADLGHWNFVDLKASRLRRSGESDDQFLQRMMATFKTPTLRHLAHTPPYMHTGAFFTLEDALQEIARLGALARAGRIRQADEELAAIRIIRDDIPPLVAFLSALNEDLKRNRPLD